MRIEESEILQRAFGNLKELLGIDAEYNQDSAEYDALACIDGHSFVCEVKTTLNSSNFNNTVCRCNELERKTGRPALLVVGSTSSNFIRKAQDCKVNVLDAAGNCSIKSEPLFVCCLGNKQEMLPDKKPLALRASGIKVLCFLLMDRDNVARPVRDIQAATGVSLGTINALITALTRNGYVILANGKRRLRNAEPLLNFFVEMYGQILKPRQYLTTMSFIPGAKGQWKELSLPQGMQWGGESGAFLLDGFLFPEKYCIYASVPSEALLRGKIAVPNKNGEIQVFQKFWNTAEDSRTVPPLIVYADLMGSGNGRCIEAAQRIKENELQYLF